MSSPAGSEWFFRLYDGLFNVYPKENLSEENLLICFQTPENKRFFRLFNSVEKFIPFLEAIDKENQSFFEIIPGFLRQKPHFDIDIKRNEFSETELATFAEQIRSEISHQFLLLGISPLELRWYSSHSKSKKSFHLVIPGYYFDNNLEAKSLYQFLSDNLPSEYRIYVDHMAYSVLQNFRLLGSSKPGQKRYKKLCRKWNFSGEEIILEKRDFEVELIESLVSKVGSAKRFLDRFKIERVSIPSAASTGIASDSFDSDLINIIDRDILNIIGVESFLLKEVIGNKLSYQRKSPSLCPICKVVHESIWQFAVILKANFDFYESDEYRVLLHCPRAPVYCKDNQKRYLEIGRYKEKTEQTYLGPVEGVKKNEKTWIGPQVDIYSKPTSEPSRRFNLSVSSEEKETPDPFKPRRLLK